EKKYPVLYLLHGAGDSEAGWQRGGSAHVILDNLIADKKAVPMIVVMPNGSPQSPSGGMGALLARPLAPGAAADKDGKWTEDELVAAAKKLFKECDKDNKGAIDEKQLAEGINRLLEGQTPARTTGRFRFGNPTLFENDLLKDIIPYIESHYP